MKSAIIIGMFQMMFGLILSFKNFRFFNDKLSLLCEWIPHMIFIWCMVGYLCLLIIIKWITVKNPSEAPSLLIGVINMFMFSPPPDGLELFKGQTQLQYFIVILAFICIPWMLLSKPYILYKRHSQKKQLILPVGIDDDVTYSRCQPLRKHLMDSQSSSIRKRSKKSSNSYLVC